MKNIKKIHLKIIIFTALKYHSHSILHGHVCVMHRRDVPDSISLDLSKLTGMACTVTIGENWKSGNMTKYRVDEKKSHDYFRNLRQKSQRTVGKYGKSKKPEDQWSCKRSHDILA